MFTSSLFLTAGNLGLEEVSILRLNSKHAESCGLLLVFISSYFFNKNCSFQLFWLVYKILAAEEVTSVSDELWRWGEPWGGNKLLFQDKTI